MDVKTPGGRVRRRSKDRRRLRVAIIGSGFGGIAAAVKLGRRTRAEVTIFEKESQLGGTWRDNHYPGAEVDIASHIYSFSFLKYDWSRTHARREELWAYVNHVVDRFGLRERIRLSTPVRGARWIEEDAQVEVAFARPDGSEGTERFDAVISAIGLLGVPRYPDWPGLEDFEGVKFHTSRWEHEHDLGGKTVAVVGTGSTAIQVVPGIAESVGRLLVFQREPGWIEPKAERAFTPFERWVYRHVPLAQRIHRYWLWQKANRRFTAYDAGSRMQERMREVCTAFIEDTVRDPATRAALTPDYAWGCKRPIVATTYYDAFNLPQVELVPHAVVAATPTGLVDATGTEHRVDVLVMSTGFQAQRILAPLDIVGRGGVHLHDAWSDRATAFLGTTVPGFPNFFILYGPNTNGGTSIIAQLEREAEIAVAAIRRLERGARVVDTDAAATRRYVEWVDAELETATSAKNSGCHNYFTDERGHIVTEWPREHWVFWWITRRWRRRGLRYA